MENNSEKAGIIMRRGFFEIGIALLLIVFGTLLLFNNLGIIEVSPREMWRLFYPMFFVLYGLKETAGYLWPGKSYYKSHSLFWGLSFLTVGSLLLLASFNVIAFELYMLWRLWPLLVIYIGISLIAGSYRKKAFDGFEELHYESRNHGYRVEDWEGKGKKYGAAKTAYTQPNWSVEPMDIWNSVGDLDFDFSKAYIPDTETEIKLSGWIGDIKILVPRDVAFCVKARAIVGDIIINGQTREGFNPSVSYKSIGFDDATKKLVFLVDYKIMDLRVDLV